VGEALRFGDKVGLGEPPSDGATFGKDDGSALGNAEGKALGRALGRTLGSTLGSADGRALGRGEGPVLSVEPEFSRPFSLALSLAEATDKSAAGS